VGTRPDYYKAAKINKLMKSVTFKINYLPLKCANFSGAGNLLSLLASRLRFSPRAGELKHAVQSGLEIFVPSTFRFHMQIFKTKKLAFKPQNFPNFPSSFGILLRLKNPLEHAFFSFSKNKKFAAKTANFSTFPLQPCKLLRLRNSARVRFSQLLKTQKFAAKTANFSTFPAQLL
jgi:hypothetical protein